MGKRLEATLGILNGTIGDYLARAGNGLATPMALIHQGTPIPFDRAGLAWALPEATPRAVLLVHGIMCTETVWEPDAAGDDRAGPDYGALLARDLGYTPLYLRYNTGRAIPDNGAALARLLEALLDLYPVPLEEILLLGHSMGGLVARSACHVASVSGQRWLRLVRRAIYVGTPHLGAPYERLGRVVTRLLRAVGDPYTRLAAEIGDLRSDGIKDLGDGDLRHEDRARRQATLALRDRRHPVPLLPEIEHYLVAGSLVAQPLLAALLGDAVVPVLSAVGGAGGDGDGLGLPASHVLYLPGVGHMALARHPEVYAQIRSWCEETP